MMLRPADIGFVKSDKLLSNVLAWFMQSKFSHSFLVVEQTPKDTYIIETNEFCLIMDSIKDHTTNPSKYCEIWSPIELCDETREQMVNEVRPMVGTIYAYWQLISQGFRRLLMRIKIKIPNLLPWGNVCDDYPIMAYKKSGIPSMVKIKKSQIDTQELYEIVSTCGAFRRVL